MRVQLRKVVEQMIGDPPDRLVGRVDTIACEAWPSIPGWPGPGEREHPLYHLANGVRRVTIVDGRPLVHDKIPPESSSMISQGHFGYHRSVEYEADLARVASAIGNRARARILDRLLQGDALPASELAADAGVALSTASGHLETLADVGLVAVERQGRQRRYRIARPEVARAIEALAVIAPRRPVTSLRTATSAERLRAGRMCYDHLAGRLGVGLTEALVTTRALRLHDGGFSVTRGGERLFRDLGLELPMIRERKRAFAIACLDWTERRVHLAGALGAALCEDLLARAWVERRGSGRAVALTDSGATNLLWFDLDIGRFVTVGK